MNRYRDYIVNRYRDYTVNRYRDYIVNRYRDYIVNRYRDYIVNPRFFMYCSLACFEINSLQYGQTFPIAKARLLTLT